MLTLRLEAEAGASFRVCLVMRDHQKAKGEVREMTAMLEHREVVTSSRRWAWETVGNRFPRTLRVTGRSDIHSQVSCSCCTRVISGRAVITAGLHENDNGAFWEWRSQNSVDQLFSMRQEKTLSPGGWGESLGSTCLLLQAFRTSQASLLSMLALCACSPHSPEVLSLGKSFDFPSPRNELLHISTSSTCPHFLHVSAQISHYQRGFFRSPDPKLTPCLTLSPNPLYSALCIFIFLHSNNHYMSFYKFMFIYCPSSENKI